MELRKNEMIDLIKGSTIEELEDLGLMILSGELLDSYLPVQDFYFDLDMFDVFYKTKRGIIALFIPHNPNNSNSKDECYDILSKLAYLKSINHNKAKHLNVALVIISNENEKYLPLLSLKDEIVCYNYSFDLRKGVLFKREDAFYCNKFLKANSGFFTSVL